MQQKLQIFNSVEEMCDDAKNENNGDEAKDNVHAYETEPTPAASLSDAITAFETVQNFGQ